MYLRDYRTAPHCPYRVDVSWLYLEDHLKHEDEIKLDLNPDFQRGHVWKRHNQEEYIEYILKGGSSGKELYFNCSGWLSTWEGPYVIVDGKQRLQAVRLFMANKIKAFGHYLKEFDDKPDMLTARFSWNIATLKSRKEVLQWYLDFNSCGVAHSKEELQKVREMLKD